MFTLTPLHRVHTLLSLLITGTSLLLSLPRLHAQAHSTFQRVNSQFPDIDLRETLRPSALKDIRNGGVSITGKVRDLSLNEITLRVTNSLGKTYLTHTVVHSEAFRVVYPKDFPSAPPITPCVLFVDALPSRSLTPDSSKRSAEITLVAYDSRKQRIPDYPTAFMTDLRDRNGKLDANSTKWRIMQPLINLYMRSYGAQLAGVGKPDFDINLPTDFATFKSSLALYDFDGRDKDWLSAQKNRPKRTFWKSVWSNWFNSSNDHPLDGNPANQNPANYMPYAFTNDFADLLITHLLRFRLTTPSEDNLSTICSEALENLLAWQNREPANFALLDKSGHQENYTAGAFRYGLFVNGDFMTEGNGWFYNPAFHDYAGGGVLNGRAVWALGEGLRAEPVGTLAKKVKEALILALQFCLNDGFTGGYTKRTPQGNIYWRDAGEHAYLTLGILNACAVMPNKIVLRPTEMPPLTLQEVCTQSLNALIDLQKPEGQWAVYPNVDSMAITALVEGASILPNHPNAKRWLQAAEKAAAGWLNVRVNPTEFQNPSIHFGLRLTPETMTYRWAHLDAKSWANRNYLFFYQSGHWIHALARLYTLTGNTRYRQRAEAMVGYLCGDNPWGVRLLNEMGGVYNWVEDRNSDGIEDYLKQDMYPESTAFTLIGLFHLLKALHSSK